MFPSPLGLVLVACATWRLSHLLAMEYGPLHLCQKLWVLLGAESDMSGNNWHGTNFVSELILCPLCLSVWFAAGLLLLTALFPWFLWVDAWLALSGVSSFLELTLRR